MIKLIQPLVVTPSPIPSESLGGFLLRVSEMNGYRSPGDILRYAGLTENEIRSVHPPIDKLAHVFAKPPADFFSIAPYTASGRTRKKEWLIKGQAIPSMYASIKSSKLCPECVLEHGHIDGFWDLKHAVACPVHRRMAITTCPCCGDTLKWQRPGLLECKCGFDLSEQRGEVVSNTSVLNLLALIKAKLHGQIQGNLQLIEAGFPLSEIERISFSTLISIIGRFGQNKRRTHRIELPSGLTDTMYALQGAAQALSRWPHGLYDYLEAIPAELKKNESFNLQRQFHQFYSSMFKSGLPDAETVFLRKAFVSFGNERWNGQGFIDIRLANRAAESRTVVGINGLAEYLKVKPPTVIKYVKAGLIKGKPLVSGKRTRLIFDLNEAPFKPSEGKYFRQREAAQFLKLPVKLLRILQKSGIYKVTRLGWGIEGYSVLDLIEFRENLLNKVPVSDDFHLEETITLRKFSRKKHMSHQKTAAVIAALLDDKIIPIGRCGNSIGDISFNKKEITKLLNEP